MFQIAREVSVRINVGVFARTTGLRRRGYPFTVTRVISDQNSAPHRSTRVLIHTSNSVINAVNNKVIRQGIVRRSLRTLRRHGPQLFRKHVTHGNTSTIKSSYKNTVSMFVDIRNVHPHLILVNTKRIGQTVTRDTTLLKFSVTITSVCHRDLGPRLFPPSAALLRTRSFNTTIRTLSVHPSGFILVTAGGRSHRTLSGLVRRPVT